MPSDRPVVFIHTNAKQKLGALVGAHALRRNARDPDGFEVRLLEVERTPALLTAKGRRFLRAGQWRVWDPDDLQSFSPLRFAPPDAMGHEGLALVIDPDVFAVGDVGDLFARDRQGKAIWCRPRPGHNGAQTYLASSVMLLDCARLPHWRFDQELEDLFQGRFDYVDWIELNREQRETIGLLEPEWNDFDRLTPQTKMLHTTKRKTQPWKSGLPVDFTLRERPLGPLPASLAAPLRRMWTRRSRYQTHPNPNIEAYFYALLAECFDAGEVDEAMLKSEMALSHIRKDSPALIDRYRGWTLPEPGPEPGPDSGPGSGPEPGPDDQGLRSAA